VVDCPNSREVTVKEKQLTSSTKTFQFDKVFGPQSKQLDVYRSVVEPLIAQVLQGYNCTVFAYGQTGTGKTFTMEGGDERGDPSVSWEHDPTSGIIPRALAQLFDELHLQQEAEFTVRTSFLELYNEEIFDLLSAQDDTTKLRLFEDSTKKGSVIVQGLEEVLVGSKSEVYKILERGSCKRKTAATLMNAHSSRSHTVFTTTVHMKESSAEGEEVLRIGKLNLVDLAGSENIGRSGAMDKRAREAGNINQSLLTLGRVITCLVDRAPHIPYRESKLTRLLQDSLGGRTKTSIIATISPAGINVEETLSTLDYAHRAKNIQNKPEVNQKMSKTAKLKEYTEEIERLRKDLMAGREKNGVFMAHDNYQNMLSNIEMTNQDLAEKMNTLKALNEEKVKLEAMFEEISAELVEKEAELGCKTLKLSETEQVLQDTKEDLQKTLVEKEEQTHLVEKYVETEVTLKEQAKTLMETVDLTNKDLTNIHNKLDRLKSVEEFNEDSKKSFHENFQDAVRNVVDSLEKYEVGQKEKCEDLQENIKTNLVKRIDNFNNIEETIQKLLLKQFTAIDEFDKSRKEIGIEEIEFLACQEKVHRKFVTSQKTAIENFEMTKLDPILANVANALKYQIEELEKLKSTLSSDMQQVKKTVNIFSVLQVDLISKLAASVENYASSREVKMKMIEAKNQEMMESEKRFKGQLDQLLESYSAHSRLVQANTDQMEAETSADLSEVRALMAESERTVKSATEGRDQAMDAIDQESVRIVEYSKAATAKISAYNMEVEKHGQEVEEVVRDHVRANGEAFDRSELEIKNSYENRAKLQAEKLEELKESLERNKTGFCQVGSEVIDTMKVIQSKDIENTALLGEKIREVSSRTKELFLGVREYVVEKKEVVKKFLSSELRRDVPSGLTPARVERSFPRVLAATSPHLRILSRYRVQAELAAAAKFSLDDTDDSGVSQSTGNLSRQSSSNEIRKISPDPAGNQRQRSTDARRTPSVSRTPSSSRAGSRPSSRSRSGLRQKSVSTSDIGSEIGDQENDDPNFRKPRALKRELKKPEIRSRKVLQSN